jgi:hypothetical protein
MKAGNRFHLATVAVLVASTLGLTDVAVAAPAVPVSSTSISTTKPTIPVQEERATWRPYDISAITTSAACERRRTWLVNNVSWVTRARSRCSAFTVPLCPRPKTVYKVMVLVDSRSATRKVDTTVPPGLTDVTEAATVRC